eukprot:SAG31_NODE_2120_length_6405_cov_3.062639_6_plen_50_part_00
MPLIKGGSERSSPRRSIRCVKGCLYGSFGEARMPTVVTWDDDLKAGTID